METSNSANSGNFTCSNKRLRSETENSDSSEINMKKHIPIHEKTTSPYAQNISQTSVIQVGFA